MQSYEIDPEIFDKEMVTRAVERMIGILEDLEAYDFEYDYNIERMLETFGYFKVIDGISDKYIKDCQIAEMLENAKKVEMDKNAIFIKKSLENAKKMVMGKKEDGSDKTYLDVMLSQRIEGPSNAGSSYEVDSPEELYKKLINQEWQEITHPDAMPGCRVFKTNLAGLEGILDMENLPDDVELYAIDPKGVGKIGIGAGKVEKNPVEETYLIIGKENIDGKDEDVVFTFHPGEPVRPSEVETKDILDGTKISKEEAGKLGFSKVKYLSEEMLEQYRHKQKAMKLEDSVNISNQLDGEIAELENEKDENKR